MILEIDNIELNYETKNILNGVYLKAETGKVTGLLGQNGSGKSSLLHIIFGSLNPKYKLIRIDKQPILKKLYSTGNVYICTQKQTIPNFIKLDKAFSLQKVSWIDFIQQFPQFEKYRKSRPSGLSGGELQVIEIYIALLSNKPIVLLDEPFMHIAPLYVEQMKNIIRKQKKNKAIILTDHQYESVIDVTDDLYLLKNGSTKKINRLTELEDYGYLPNGVLELAKND